MSLFYPTILRKRVTSITAEDLRALGVRGLLLDVDNTLTTHGSQALDPAVLAWLRAMEAAGFTPTVVSNALRKRVEPFAGFLRAAKRLGLPRGQCVVIGDQTFTDVLGARLAGIPCIQVLPIQLEEHKPLMQLKRRLEKGILARYTRKTNTTE